MSSLVYNTDYFFFNFPKRKRKKKKNSRSMSNHLPFPKYLVVIETFPSSNRCCFLNNNINDTHQNLVDETSSTLRPSDSLYLSSSTSDFRRKVKKERQSMGAFPCLALAKKAASSHRDKLCQFDGWARKYYELEDADPRHLSYYCTTHCPDPLWLINEGTDVSIYIEHISKKLTGKKNASHRYVQNDGCENPSRYEEFEKTVPPPPASSLVEVATESKPAPIMRAVGSNYDITRPAINDVDTKKRPARDIVRPDIDLFARNPSTIDGAVQYDPSNICTYGINESNQTDANDDDILLGWCNQSSSRVPPLPPSLSSLLSHLHLLQRYSDMNYAMRGFCLDGDEARYSTTTLFVPPSESPSGKENVGNGDDVDVEDDFEHYLHYYLPGIFGEQRHDKQQKQKQRRRRLRQQQCVVTWLPKTNLNQHRDNDSIVDTCHADLVDPDNFFLSRLTERNLLKAIETPMEGYNHAERKKKDSIFFFNYKDDDVISQAISICAKDLRCISFIRSTISKKVVKSLLVAAPSLRGIIISNVEYVCIEEQDMSKLLSACINLQWLMIDNPIDVKMFGDSCWKVLVNDGIPNLQVLWINSTESCPNCTTTTTTNFGGSCCSDGGGGGREFEKGTASRAAIDNPHLIRAALEDRRRKDTLRICMINPYCYYYCDDNYDDDDDDKNNYDDVGDIISRYVPGNPKADKLLCPSCGGGGL